MRFTIDTIVELITNSRILVVEETVGAVTQGINANFGFLNIFATATFYVERIITFFLIGIAIFK